MSPITTPVTYTDVFSRLELDNVRYVVIGGISVFRHGYARPISDLDIAIDRTPQNARQTMLTLAASGFVPTVPLLDAVTMLRMFDYQNREVGVFARYHIAFEDLWSDALRIPVGDSTARVASLENVIKGKRFNSRPQDLGA